MLKIEVYSRADLSKVIECAYIPQREHLTLEDVMLELCPAYSREVAQHAYLSVFADGVKIPVDMWPLFHVKHTRTIRVVIEAGGLEASAIVGIISLVVAVASAIYGIVMMNKLGKANAQETKQGSSIYDVNAQGNQVNLTNVIPENFGFFKRFPDYLADRHVFYRNNHYFVDVLLCQGVGQYDRKTDHSDVYLGETPINELDGCSVYVFEPGQVITADNSAGERSWYGYYSSTEVSGSGRTLEPFVTEIDQSSQFNSTVKFSANTLSGSYYTYQMTGGGGGCTGPGGSVPIYHALNLGWGVGAIFLFSGSIAIRPIGMASAITANETGGTSDIPLTLASYFNAQNQTLHKSWLRQRETTIEVDPDTEEETEVITRAGDQINVQVTAVTSVSYNIVSGTGGVHSTTVSNEATINSQCELIGVVYGEGDNAIITVETSAVSVPDFPKAPSTPQGAMNLVTTQTLQISINQPIPADYPFGNDNGNYKITEIDNHVYTLQRVSDSYEALTDWVEFWAQEVNQTGLTFTLDTNVSDTAGAYVGPFRACPYGAKSSIFEYDILFPGGLGHLENDGTFSEHSVSIEIGYRRAGSDDEWVTTQKTFTGSSNDELAYTFQIELETADNYEFRMKNLSEGSNSTRDLEECKWVGLKSVVSTKNQYEGVTVLLCRFKGSQTLSELSSNQISTYWTRKLPNIATGDLEPTRELAPAVKYIVNTSKYKGILDEQSLAEYNAFWNAKNITLDGTLDGDGTLLQVLRDVLSIGFASPVIDNNKLAFRHLHKRGENEPLVQIFQPQNLTKSAEITFNLPKDEDTDEIVCEYTSPETYKTETIYCHIDADGNADITDYPKSVHQETLKAFGVTNRRQAVAMGMRRLRYLRCTRVTYKIETELDGLNCQYNDLVGLVLDEELSTITGRITASEDDLKNVTVDMEIPEALSAGTVYVRTKDGACMVTTYTRKDSHHLTLTDPLPEWDEHYGEDLEYPFFTIGDVAVCWVTAVEPADKSVTLTLINYNEDMFKDDL